jgi:hypothetical protein
VLIAPASTDTTTSSVGSSVIRSPSTCRFSIPAAFNAASISRPPPCTTTSGTGGGDAADGRHDRLQPFGALEQLASEFQNQRSSHKMQP